MKVVSMTVALALLGALLLVCAPPAASTGQTIGCGSDITGTVTLTVNIGPCLSNAPQIPVGPENYVLVVTGNHTVLNCAGHTLSGNGTGIVVYAGIGDVVENCIVDAPDSPGSAVGFFVWLTTNSYLLNNTADNGYIGFYFEKSSNNTITGTATGNVADLYFDYGSSSNSYSGNFGTIYFAPTAYNNHDPAGLGGPGVGGGEKLRPVI